jgi:hypothetical protein
VTVPRYGGRGERKARERRRQELLDLIARQTAEGTLVIRQARPGELLPPKRRSVQMRRRIFAGLAQEEEGDESGRPPSRSCATSGGCASATWNQDRTRDQIAEEVGCTRTSVALALQRHKIPKRRTGRCRRWAT